MPLTMSRVLSRHLCKFSWLDPVYITASTGGKQTPGIDVYKWHWRVNVCLQKIDFGINTLILGDAYMRLWTGSALIQVMA